MIYGNEKGSPGFTNSRVHSFVLFFCGSGLETCGGLNCYFVPYRVARTNERQILPLY